MKFTKLSSKGQVVIPQDIRESMKLKPGAPLAVVEDKGIILIKKVKMPEIKSWEEVTKPFKEAARKSNFTLRDLNRIIKEYRRTKRSK